MAINSQITMRTITGQNPIGFIPLVPNNGGAFGYIGSTNFTREYEYSTVTFTLNDIPQTQDDFLTMVKDDLDNTWTPTIFTDPLYDYDLEYQIKGIRLDYKTDTVDRSIWTERTYYYYVTVLVLANITVI